MSQYHTPIMVEEVMEGLQVAPGKRFIDATVGGGGHAAEFVKRGGIVLGIDTDTDAVEEVKKSISGTIVQGNFRNIQTIAQEHGFEHVDGILFDLGVSSHQVDTAGRGFSYRYTDAPLDLRLDQTKGLTAAEYLEHVSEQELYETLATYSEEEHSRGIAAAIVGARRAKPVETTGDLLHIVQSVVGARQSAPTASRIFQALRIHINDEFTALKEGLKGAGELLKPGGRLAVISFHSLEDRIVKQYMRSDGWKLITKRPVCAGERELMENRRSRSAKLRIAEKL